MYVQVTNSKNGNLLIPMVIYESKKNFPFFYFLHLTVNFPVSPAAQFSMYAATDGLSLEERKK
jgi:hypothetical protein